MRTQNFNIVFKLNLPKNIFFVGKLDLDTCSDLIFTNKVLDNSTLVNCVTVKISALNLYNYTYSDRLYYTFIYWI